MAQQTEYKKNKLSNECNDCPKTEYLDGGKQHRVLVVVDMQNDFITGSLGNDDCQKVVTSVVNVIKTGNYDQVFLTRDTHGEDYLKTQEGRKLPVIHTVKNTEGWQIQKDVMDSVTKNYKQEQVTVIDKPCFGSEELADLISKLGQEYPEDGRLTVDFVGVCTDICVISNVFLAKAAAMNADVRVIEKACAGVTPQTHQTAIEAMRGCQVEII
ncbi:MAG: cysteine hydrolase [Clostridia bacterium]|nr:cysteine hydrolase [Clostridia bacterium]MDY5555066.1 isochorismatase family cysteine hydrolase [Blautia sp.]